MFDEIFDSKLKNKVLDGGGRVIQLSGIDIPLNPNGYQEST